MSGQTYDDILRVRVKSSQRDRLEETAHAQSEPGDTVTTSHLVRKAIDEWLESGEADELPSV